MSLEFENETYLLRRCFFEVQNEVGRGRREEAYHRACALWFESHELPVVSKLPHRLLLRGEIAHSLFPDFVCWDAISVELKAVPRNLSRAEFVQLYDYLKCRRDRIGLLVNMGLSRVEIERIIYEPPQTAWVENWDSWKSNIEGSDRDIGLAIREALRTVYDEHTTGYGTEVVGRLVYCALRQHGLTVIENPVAKSFFRGIEVHESSLRCLIVNERIVLTLSALFDTIEFSAERGKSFLQALDLPWGVAVDFGKTRVEVLGIRQEC